MSSEIKKFKEKIIFFMNQLDEQTNKYMKKEIYSKKEIDNFSLFIKNDKEYLSLLKEMLGKIKHIKEEKLNIFKNSLELCEKNIQLFEEKRIKILQKHQDGHASLLQIYIQVRPALYEGISFHSEQIIDLQQKVSSLLQERELAEEDIASLYTLQRKLENLKDCGQGKKTKTMMQSLARGVLKDYDKHKNVFIYQGKEFQIITGNTKDTVTIPSVSIGENITREVILFDPQNSPLLEKHYLALIKKLKEISEENKMPLSLEDALRKISAFTYGIVFDYDLCDKGRFNFFLEKWVFSHPEQFTITDTGQKIPVVPIDDIVSGRIGICRHFAFVMNYFLGKMSNDLALHDLLPPGQTYLVRGTLEDGSGHSWNFYIPANRSLGYWHIDVYSSQIKNCAKAADLQILYQFYGKAVIDFEMQRYTETT